MAYEPTVWQAGDTITSVRLNKLEQGVAQGGGGTLVVEVEVVEDEEEEQPITD